MSALNELVTTVDRLIHELEAKNSIIEDKDRQIRSLEKENHNLKRELDSRSIVEQPQIVNGQSSKKRARTKTAKKNERGPRPSERFVKQLKVNLSPKCVLLDDYNSVMIQQLTPESHQEFCEFLDSLIGDMMKASGNFFSVIQKEPLKKLVMKKIKNLGTSNSSPQLSHLHSVQSPFHH